MKVNIHFTIVEGEEEYTAYTGCINWMYNCLPEKNDEFEFNALREILKGKIYSDDNELSRFSGTVFYYDKKEFTSDGEGNPVINFYFKNE